MLNPSDSSTEPATDPASRGEVRRSGSASEPSAEPLRIMAFSLDDEWYGLEIHHIRGIERDREITPVPQSPSWLAGVFNLHGLILPAIDPRPLLRGSAPGWSPDGVMIIFQFDGHQAALLADGADEIYELSTASLEPQLPTVEPRTARLIRGSVRVRDRLIGVVDLEAMVDLLLKG